MIKKNKTLNPHMNFRFKPKTTGAKSNNSFNNGRSYSGRRRGSISSQYSDHSSTIMDGFRRRRGGAPDTPKT